MDVRLGSSASRGAGSPGAGFLQGDLEALPCRDAAFDVAVWCGSTLSFVDASGRGRSREFARALRPGGRLLLEVEHRWSLDLAWRLASSLTGDALGYGVTPREARRAFARPLREGIWIDYPGYPTLRLFTRSELARLLGNAGLPRSGRGAFTRRPTSSRRRCSIARGSRAW